VVETGVTIHFMDEDFDTGDVALQRSFLLSDGISHAKLETNLAQLGSDLLLEAVQKAASGTLPRQPQPLGFRSHPWPREADFVLDTGWSARHAFNFMRGTMNWNRPYFVQVKDERIWLKTAVAFEPETRLSQPMTRQENSVLLQFSPGVLQATLSN
jgi:methionyl-tRNA formyltransferase